MLSFTRISNFAKFFLLLAKILAPRFGFDFAFDFGVAFGVGFDKRLCLLLILFLKEKLDKVGHTTT